MEEEAKNRAPRELPAGGTSDHVILTAYDQVTAALIEKLRSHDREYVLLVDDHRKALELYDSGIRVAVGNIDDPETYRRMKIDWAALVAATNSDEINTNIAFTVRALNEHVPIITTADSPYSEDILYMAGSTKVIQLHEMLGRSLAAWTVGGDCRSTVISRFDGLVMAEFSTYGTPLVGKRLAESNIREEFGLSVVGIWERGHFTTPNAQTLIEANSVLVLAGSQKNMDAFDDVYSFYHVCRTSANQTVEGGFDADYSGSAMSSGVQTIFITKGTVVLKNIYVGGPAGY